MRIFGTIEEKCEFYALKCNINIDRNIFSKMYAKNQSDCARKNTIRKQQKQYKVKQKKN